jgi:VWFA-related protein
MRQYFQRVLTRGVFRTLLPWVTLSICLLSISSGAAPQNANPPQTRPQPAQTHEAQPTFQLHAERNLVTVRVVVRDSDDRPVGNLRKEDFRLFDEGKPQDILGFTVEAGNPNRGTEVTTPAPGEKTPEVPRAPAKALAQRFVALYFDDLHLTNEEVGRTRNAAWGYITKSVGPQDRVAVFTSSTQGETDFTDDHDKLHQALFRLAPRSRTLVNSDQNSGPDIGEYQAYRIDQYHDQDAIKIAYFETYYYNCVLPGMNNQSCQDMSMTIVRGQAAQIWSLADMQSQDSLQGIENAVRRLAGMPGQRNLVLVSPGFLNETREREMDAIIDRALRQGVVISAIDAAGLMPRKIQGALIAHPELAILKNQIETAGTVLSGGVLASLSAGTGGVFFHNSNDFGDGFRQAAAIPEVYYVLTFSPLDIKMDGKFHALKVTVKSDQLLTVQARRGYYASTAALAGQPSSRDELEKVVFSQEEVHGLPANITTQVARTSGRESNLTVIIHVDVRLLQFRKEADRSVDKLIFHTTLFDRDGKYVTAKEASLDLHLRGKTLEKLSQSGLYAQTSFEVAPGTYRVREVVRDTESKEMSALNCVVEVPGPPSPQGAEKP